MATKRQTSVPDISALKANDSAMKTRIKELEEEVFSLKKRLDELRKAKNTTITKREREVIEVGTPFAKRDSSNDLKVASLEKKLHKTDKDKDKEIEDLRKKFEAELDAAKRSNKKGSNQNCNHEAELLMLKTSIEELESDNAALRLHSDDLKDKIKSLEADLSIKEANWCENEEKLKMQTECIHQPELLRLHYKLEDLEDENKAHRKQNEEYAERVEALMMELLLKEAQWCAMEDELTQQLKVSFNEQYKEWMQKTEAKIRELQETNDLLRGYLKDKK